MTLCIRRVLRRRIKNARSPNTVSLVDWGGGAQIQLPNVSRVAPETRELLVLTLLQMERYTEVKEIWLATQTKVRES